MEVPPPGQYSATVLSISLFERGERTFALITYQLDSEPPFAVPEFVSLREARDGTSALKGRARLREVGRCGGH